MSWKNHANRETQNTQQVWPAFQAFGSFAIKFWRLSGTKTDLKIKLYLIVRLKISFVYPTENSFYKVFSGNIARDYISVKSNFLCWLESVRIIWRVKMYIRRKKWFLTLKNIFFQKFFLTIQITFLL